MTTPHQTKSTPDTAEMKAVGAFLAAMHDNHLDGGKMREAMIWALGSNHSSTAAPAAVAYRVLRKRHDGEWVTDGRAWCDGVPTQDLVDDIALRSDGWRIEYAFAAPTTQAAPQPAAPASQDAEDAARYRWLKSRANLTLQSLPRPNKWARADGSEFSATHYLAEGGTQRAPAESLDAAIDAARAAKEGAKHGNPHD